LAKVSECPPDLITLDLMMPVMDGWEFLRRYRDLPNCADTPILVMSAVHRAQFDLLEHCEVLTKPFDLDELVAVVGRLVLLAA
jgi:CheY-like chemotaxis protein